MEKQPLRPAAGGLELSDMSSKPAAYPGGQSLPPWPYPEAKPTARPTPASYDPACILKVSWPRDAARPTEDTLRETFARPAPVHQRRSGQRQRRDGGVQGRRRRARGRGRLRRAVADRARQAPRGRRRSAAAAAQDGRGVMASFKLAGLPSLYLWVHRPPFP